MKYSLNEIQAGDVVMSLKNERRGKTGFICYGFMYNVVRIQLIQCKNRGLTDEIGLLLSQSNTHWIDWNGKPGLWHLGDFRICYRPKHELIEQLMKGSTKGKK